MLECLGLALVILLILFPDFLFSSGETNEIENLAFLTLHSMSERVH